MQHPTLEQLVRRDPRYAYEAYEFVFAALSHTQLMLGHNPNPEPGQEEEAHVTPRQLLHGIRDLALREFGMMAGTVFRMWGVQNTGDFGVIVFILIEAGLMSKTTQDDLVDFQDVFDLNEMVQGYRIDAPVEAEENG